MASTSEHNDGRVTEQPQREPTLEALARSAALRERLHPIAETSQEVRAKSAVLLQASQQLLRTWPAIAECAGPSGTPWFSENPQERERLRQDRRARVQQLMEDSRQLVDSAARHLHATEQTLVTSTVRLRPSASGKSDKAFQPGHDAPQKA